MKVWLDDVRNPKAFKGWEDSIWVTTPEEAIEYLKTGAVLALSLDNDLGLSDDENGQPRDGYSVAKWIEQEVIENDTFVPPDTLNAHTANPVGLKKIEVAFRQIKLAFGRR